MKAITVKYFGATNSKGSRLRVQAEGCPTRFYSYEYSYNDGGRKQAAIKYIQERGWKIGSGLIHAGLPDGQTDVFVFIDSHEFYNITPADALGLVE